MYLLFDKNTIGYGLFAIFNSLIFRHFIHTFQKDALQLPVGHIFIP